MSSSTGKTTNSMTEFLQSVKANQFLQEDNADTSLQPGEEYPVAPHPSMIDSYKQKTATLNQITTLVEKDPREIPADQRAKFIAVRDETIDSWLFPHTVENPCGILAFDHWKTKFNTAVVQIVTAQFQKDRRNPRRKITF
jgi:hypothetical protein